MNLYHLTKFCLYFSFTVHYFFSKISSFTLILSRRTVLDSFCLFIFCFEKFSTTFAVNLTLNVFRLQPISHTAHTFDSSLKPLERVGAGERWASKARKLCFQYFILIYSTIGYIWLFTSTLLKVNHFLVVKQTWQAFKNPPTPHILTLLEVGG